MTDDYKTALATIELLAETYPQCFAVFEQRRRPLKLGIHHDILAALNGAITPKELTAAMRVYCGNAWYLKACVEGAPRVDLNGEAAGYVSAEEADNAKQRLQQRRHAKASNSERHWEPAPPDPGIIPGGIRDRALKAMGCGTTTAQTKPEPRRLSLADLRAAARERQSATQGRETTMQKPKPQTFADETEEDKRTMLDLLDRMCWLTAADMSLDLDMSQEECADWLKQRVFDGRYILEFDRANDRARIIPAPSLATHPQ